LSDYKRTNHTDWDCKYLILFIPKYRELINDNYFCRTNDN